MILNQLEQTVIDKILDIDSIGVSILKKQITNVSVTSIKSSTPWFFTEIEVDKSKAVPIKNITKKFIFWDVGLNRKNESYMWFILFIKEWYTYDQEFNDFTIFANYSFNDDTFNVRDISEELK